MGLHFISYSSPHGDEFADWLYGELWNTAPPTQPLDQRDLDASLADDTYLEHVISSCSSLLFVLSHGAWTNRLCRKHLALAGQLGRPIFVLRIDPRVTEPTVTRDLAVMGDLDFAPDPQDALAALRCKLRELTSTSGLLKRNRMRQLRKDRELRTAGPAERPILRQQAAAIQSERDELLSVAEQQPAAAPAQQAATAAEDEHPVGAASRSDVRRTMYSAAPCEESAFRDREDDIEHLRDDLRDDAVRIISVTGEEGIGKTRIVDQVLGELVAGRDEATVDAIISLMAHPARPVSAASVLEALQRYLPADDAASLEQPLAEPDLPLRQKLDALLARLAGIRVLVTVDGLESMLDERTGDLEQTDLDELLRFFGRRRDHRVTFMLLSRRRPEPLLEHLSGGAREINIRSGLPRTDAGDLLCGLDPDNLYGLREASPTILDEAYELTGGNPQALEALCGNLTLPDSPYTSLRQLLDAAVDVSPAKALDFLVGKLLKHLDLSAWSVAQALAIYSQPVSRDAIEELLQPYSEGRPIGAALDQLSCAGLIRQEGDCFYLPPPNESRVLKLIPKGSPADRDCEGPPFTRYALFHLAAAAFGRRQTRDVRRVEDLSPRFSQIDMLIKGEQHDEALRLINEIDERYLDRWGYSQLLVRQRKALRDNLDDDWHRLVNLNALGRIYERGNNLPDAFDCYRKALAIARKLPRVDAQKKLYVNIAHVQMARGWLHEALDFYTRALNIASEFGRVAEEVKPLTGLAEYHAHIGAFPRALQYAEKALAIAKAHDMPDDCTSLLCLTGRWRGLLGETLTALDCLRRGLALAKERGNHPLEGRLLDAIAELFIELGRPARAATLAEKAVEIGNKINSPMLRREAGFTLALARLCIGDLNAAQEAAERACAYRRRGQAPFLLALRGIILLQLGNFSLADSIFTEALGEADIRQESERNRRDHDFALLDLEGVVRCGLAVSSDQWDNIDKAVRAFQQARTITRAPGVVMRVLRILCELEDALRWDAAWSVLKAASGEPGPPKEWTTPTRREVDA